MTQQENGRLWMQMTLEKSVSESVSLVCGFVLFVYVNINQSTNCIPVVQSYPVMGSNELL